MFRTKRINLIVTKSFLAYFFVTLLSQWVDNLNMFIIVEKIIVITSLRFFFQFAWFRNFHEIYKLITFVNISLRTTRTIATETKNYVYEKRYCQWVCTKKTNNQNTIVRFYARKTCRFSKFTNCIRFINVFDSFRQKTSILHWFECFQTMKFCNNNVLRVEWFIQRCHVFSYNHSINYVF